MPIEIHEKSTSKGPKFRVWDTRSDGYWQDYGVTSEEIRNVLMTNGVERAINGFSKEFYTEGSFTTQKVKEWNRQHRDDTTYPEGYWIRRMGELHGVTVNVRIKTRANGVKSLPQLSLHSEKKAKLRKPYRPLASVHMNTQEIFSFLKKPTRMSVWVCVIVAICDWVMKELISTYPYQQTYWAVCAQDLFESEVDHRLFRRGPR